MVCSFAEAGDEPPILADFLRRFMAGGRSTHGKLVLSQES
jgi:hypothetical protein